jgi:hypothetical protein
LNFAFITNAMTAIHEYGAKGFWQSLLVFAVIAIGSNVADHYLGAGNFVSTELATLNQPASPTIVISPPNSGRYDLPIHSTQYLAGQMACDQGPSPRDR